MVHGVGSVLLTVRKPIHVRVAEVGYTNVPSGSMYGFRGIHPCVHPWTNILVLFGLMTMVLMMMMLMMMMMMML